MNRLTALTELRDFTHPSEDLSTLLQRNDNSDIAAEFPATVLRYGVSPAETAKNLEAARELYKIGSREQFIVFSGERAVGLCLITNQVDIPSGLHPDAPNISGFIANPYRDGGLGRFSIEERMKIVEENFNNRAWTFVKDGNDKSEHLVTSVGFEKTERAVKGWAGHHLYLYGDVEL